MPDLKEHYDLRPLGVSMNATAMRPLLGLTVLVVEDSRYASEAMRLLCIRSGARIRRADSLTAARRHLQVYRPSVVIVDLGLPDGSGIDLIQSLGTAEREVRPIIIATSGADGEGFGEKALAAGADEFLAKPMDTVSMFQQAILRHLPPSHQPMGPRLVSEEVIEPDSLALGEDLAHLEELLKSGADSLPYVAPFLQGLARLSGDQELRDASECLSKAFQTSTDVPETISQVRAVIRARASEFHPV